MDADTTAPAARSNPSDLGSVARPSTRAPSSALADLSLVLGVAGLLPILPVVGSVAAVVLGWWSPATDAGGRSDRARAGIALGLVGLAAPLVALFVYCVVLGYPFPIHRYQS